MWKSSRSGAGDRKAPDAEVATEEDAAQQQAADEETPLLKGPTIMTVLVDQQDALVLKFARESGASIDFALREQARSRAGDDRTGDAGLHDPTLQYYTAGTLAIRAGNGRCGRMMVSRRWPALWERRAGAERVQI